MEQAICREVSMDRMYFYGETDMVKGLPTPCPNIAVIGPHPAAIELG